VKRFKIGDRVRVVAYPPHDPQHVGRTATIVLVDGPAYGVIIDGMESMGVHKWYVADEMVPIAESPAERRQIALGGWGTYR
jgi:hypothetical protein